MWKKFNISKLFRCTESPATKWIISEFQNQNFLYTKPEAIKQEKISLNDGKISKYFIPMQKNNHHAMCFAMPKRNFSITNKTFNWRSHMGVEDKRRKIIPKLIYLHNPWKYMITKYNLLKLRLLWDHEFAEEEFIRGSKQAAVVLTDIIRTQNTEKVSQFTTPLGFQQITRDMLLSRNDARLKLIKFDTEHLRRAIPIQVATRTNYAQKYCFIDMLFVGLRNTQDFNTPEEVFEVREILRQLDADMKTPMEAINVPHRIVFVEILIRFRRNYSDITGISRDQVVETDNRDWAVSFYKILTFDVLNYDPRS